MAKKTKASLEFLLVMSAMKGEGRFVNFKDTARLIDAMK